MQISKVIRVTACRRSHVLWIMILADFWAQTHNKLMLNILYCASKKSEQGRLLILFDLRSVDAVNAHLAKTTKAL